MHRNLSACFGKTNFIFNAGLSGDVVITRNGQVIEVPGADLRALMDLAERLNASSPMHQMDVRSVQILLLYRSMPGAPAAPIVQGEAQWGDIMGNQHWEFCEMIVDMIGNMK